MNDNQRELKPCRVCGNRAPIVFRDTTLWGFGVVCGDCTENVGGMFRSVSDAIAEWNRQEAGATCILMQDD